MNSNQLRIVIVDDSPADRRKFANALARAHDANVLALGSLSDNVDRILEHRPMMVLLDDRLGPLLTADDSLRTIAKELAGLPVIVMSGDVGPARRAELIRLGASECIEKDALGPDMIELIVAMAQQRNALLKRSPPSLANSASRDRAYAAPRRIY